MDCVQPAAAFPRQPAAVGVPKFFGKITHARGGGNLARKDPLLDP